MNGMSNYYIEYMKYGKLRLGLFISVFIILDKNEFTVLVHELDYDPIVEYQVPTLGDLLIARRKLQCRRKSTHLLHVLFSHTFLM